MTKSRVRSTPPSRRRTRAQKAWKVEIQRRRPPVSTSFPTRPRISSAALFVNVTARISSGAARPAAISRAVRYAITRVFPDPAPATIRSGPSVCSTARSCSGFSPERKSMPPPPPPGAVVGGPPGSDTVARIGSLRRRGTAAGPGD